MKLPCSALLPTLLMIPLCWSFVKVFKKDTPYLVLSSYSQSKKETDSVPSYNDEALSELARLKEAKFFKSKTVAIWAGTESPDQHGDVFSLFLAAKYLLDHPENCHVVSDKSQLTNYDLILSPWREYKLRKHGLQLTHADNWLYIYTAK